MKTTNQHHTKGIMDTTATATATAAAAAVITKAPKFEPETR